MTPPPQKKKLVTNLKHYWKLLDFYEIIESSKNHQSKCSAIQHNEYSKWIFHLGGFWFHQSSCYYFSSTRLKNEVIHTCMNSWCQCVFWHIVVFIMLDHCSVKYYLQLNYRSMLNKETYLTSADWHRRIPFIHAILVTSTCCIILTNHSIPRFAVIMNFTSSRTTCFIYNSTIPQGRV